MAMITIKAWLDSGANIHSCREVDFDMDEDEWNSMTEAEKDECAKELAWDRMDWGWTVKE